MIQVGDQCLITSTTATTTTGATTRNKSFTNSDFKLHFDGAFVFRYFRYQRVSQSNLFNRCCCRCCCCCYLRKKKVELSSLHSLVRPAAVVNNAWTFVSRRVQKKSSPATCYIVSYFISQFNCMYSLSLYNIKLPLNNDHLSTTATIFRSRGWSLYTVLVHILQYR